MNSGRSMTHIQPSIFKLDIFERSVDPLIIESNQKSQIFESPNKNHNVISPLTPISRQNSPSSHLIENYIPTCLDVTAEILSDDSIDLDSVNVLSPVNTRRRSSSLIPSSSSLMSPILKQQTQTRNNSISRRLSETYFLKKHSLDDDHVVVVPFYSYFDMINSEKPRRWSQPSLSDDDISYVNDSNLDDYFFSNSDFDESNVTSADMEEYDDDDEELLSVCSVRDLLKCNTCELRRR